MTQLIVNVPDDQLDFITKLLTRLELEVAQQQQEELPNEIKKMLDDADNQYVANPESAKPWADVKRDLLAKHGK